MEPTNHLRRFNGRTNLSLRPSPTWNLAVNLGYVTGRTLLSCEAGCGGVTWGSYFSTPANLYVQTPPRRGYRSYTSDAYWALFENFQDLARFTGSIQVNHRPTAWFTQRLSAGIDEVREDNESITENSPLLAIWAPGSLGGKWVSRRDAIYHTVDYSAAANFALTEALSSKSSVGLQYYRKYFEYVTAEGSDFALPGLRAVSATARRNAYKTLVEHRVGYPVGAWFHRRIVSAEIDAATGKVKPETMMCDAGPGKAPVPCFTGTAITAPMVFLGQTLPKNEGAVSTTLTLFERVRLYALVDFKTGFRKWDHVLRVRCSLFNICRENMYPTEYDPVTIAAYQNADRFGAAYINDASYAKLREVSASYTLPAAWVQRFGASRASVTLAGHNLYTWTKWTGMEPEAMFLAGARGGFVQLEQNHLPQLTQFVTTVNVSF